MQTPILRTLFVALVILLLGPNFASAQRAAKTTPQKTWLSPSIGFGSHGTFYNGILKFSDNSVDFLMIDPGSAFTLGLQIGHRFQPSLTGYLSLSTSSTQARYIEDLTVRPSLDLRTTLFEVGILHDIGNLKSGPTGIPIQLGGGLSLVTNKLKNFAWDGILITSSSTSLGFHGLGALEIPFEPSISFRGQIRMNFTAPSYGDLEKKIAAAEGGGVTASMDSGWITDLGIRAGLSFNL